MALVDDRGRLFGRLNIIDAAVAVLLLGLIPLAYLGYVLFRQPEPALLSVVPATLSPQVARVEVKGRNLRPFLRVSFNEYQGRTFALVDSETAQIEIPQLPPGTYDVVLYDVAREISRLSGAVTVQGPVVPPSLAKMLVAGRFVGVDEAVAAQIKVGSRFTAMGDITSDVLARGEPGQDRRAVQFSDHFIEAPLTVGRDVPALIRTTCQLSDRFCQVGGINIEPRSALPLFLDGRPVRFVVSDASADGATRLIDVHATFLLPDAATRVIRTGDRSRRDPLFGDRVPVLTTTSEPRRRPAKLGLNFATGFGGGDELSFDLDDAATLIDATVRVRVDVTTDGLQYRGRIVRAGAAFVFDHDLYLLRGWVRAVEVLPEGAGERK